MSDQLAVVLLTEIRDELRGLRRDFDALPRALVAAQRERGTAPADDSARHLLRAIAAFVGVRAFNASELARHALLPQSVDLSAAIVKACGVVNGRRIGKALARVEGQSIDGLVISRVGTDAAGVVWVCAFANS